jgi:hypothetical protein
VAVAETDPLIVIGRQPQVGAERWYPYGEHDHTARLRPGLQPANRTTGELADPRTDQDDIETVDHCCKYIDPGDGLEIAGNHHQSLECHTHVGGSAYAQLGKADNTDPCSFGRWRRRESKRQGHRGPAAAGDGRTTLEGWQQTGERLVHR